MKRIMIAGTHSGCGKTTVTCAILQALVNRGLTVSSFKCGPDYIDPMFHSRIIGTSAHNLDGFFCDKPMLLHLLNRYAKEISVIEGVMGFYDGIGDKGSSHQTAVDTQTPVILVIDCKGMSRSIGAVMQGFLSFLQPNRILGCIFNRLPESLTDTAKALCRQLHVRWFGRFPYCREGAVESRHLGLVTAGEIDGLKQKMQTLAALAEQHLEMDSILAAAGECGALPAAMPPAMGQALRDALPYDAKIAVARDRAFCFYYEENIDLLRDLGCDIVPFSPLTDGKLPPHIDGLLLGGGYPELYAERLSSNAAMREDIRTRLIEGLPVIAECGGFMYLHESMEGDDGKRYDMVGRIHGSAYKTNRLQRFGYLYLTAQSDNLLCAKGERLPAHEFHYWDSTCGGDGFTAVKASNGLTYPCIHASERMYAGFPHLYFPAQPQMAVHFVKACQAFRTQQRG